MKDEDHPLIHTAIHNKNLLPPNTIIPEFSLNLHYTTSISTREWALSLVKKHLYSMYENAKDDFGGWDSQAKLKELSEPFGRYLISSDDLGPCGFVYFQFVLEESVDPPFKIPVLYVYEISLEDRVMKKGLARHLMKIIHEIAKNTNMLKVMLTCFKENSRALTFYDALGYEMDDISPDWDDDSRSYVILSILSK